VIDGWPGRGDTVLWTGGQRPIPLRVADAYVVEAGGFAYLIAYRPGTDQPRTYYVRRGEVSVLANCPRCLGTWADCNC
jgi:hypothetical protein